MAAAASLTGTQQTELWAVVAVETSGCGFLPDRRPQILFERHVFHRLTGGKYDDGDISDPIAGGYGSGGVHQYDRLAAAIAKDRTAALKSASWGLGQIMGTNCVRAGFADVEAMVTATAASEDDQLSAMGNFMRSTGLAVALAAHDWTRFARGYNGPNYALNDYDQKLAHAYEAVAQNGPPDLQVRSVQLYLTYLGYSPGKIDGVLGPRTLAALRQFQIANNLPIAPQISGVTVDQVSLALPAIVFTTSVSG
ncbi:MAG: N-acetylmuramidase domain-containing protein [Terriglobales bacterium]